MQFDITIIGGGIVGLASAYQLKQQNPSLKIALIEKEMQLAQHQTGHNSGVIHSGIYYKPKSLKAQNCIRGYHQLLDFCNKNEIAYDLCGKVIVATKTSELQALENIYQRGLENGLEGLIKLSSKAELQAYEPYLNGIAGIFVPQTGIIDYKRVAQKYAENFKVKDGQVYVGERVLDIHNRRHYSEVFTTRTSYTSRLVINCAGLYSDKVARMTQDNIDIKIIPFRGEYFSVKEDRKHLVKNLIYPVPNPSFPFLGVHFTRMIDGSLECGPNAVLAFKREGYKKRAINLEEALETLTWRGLQKVALKYWRIGLGEFYRSFSKQAFTKALQRLIPDIREEDLVPEEAGVRAQACDKEGGLLDDFSLLEDEHHIHVLNAPSPAATSSLSIGQTISQMALKRF